MAGERSEAVALSLTMTPAGVHAPRSIDRDHRTGSGGLIVKNALNMMKRASWGVGLTLALLSGAATLAQAQSVIKYTPSAEPRTMDPVLSSVAITQQHAYLVYDTLFSLDEKLQPQPQMVGKVEKSDGGRVYVMTLRPGLKFHDGSPVRSADVVASINRWATRDTVGRKLVELGMKVSAVDDQSFRVEMKQDTPLLLDGFAKPTSSALFIMREKEALTDSSKPVAEIVGSGPFRMVEYKPGARIVYERNPDYVPRQEPASYFAGGKVAKVDRVEWVIMPDAATAVSALQTGEIDIYESPPLDLVPVLETNKSVEIRLPGGQGQVGLLRPNFKQPPFDKVEARRGLALLMDQADAMSVVAGAEPKFWSKCYSFLGCGGVSEDQSGMDWMQKPDIAEAKKLFKQAGYDGKPIVVIAPGDNEVIKNFGMIAAERLKEAGLNVDLQLSDFASMIARRGNQGPTDKGGWNLFPMWSFGFETDNPISHPQLNLVCSNAAYAGWACSPEIEQLKSAWALETDPVKRKEIIHKIQLASAELLPFVPLGRFYSPMAFRRNVTDVLKTPLPVFWNLEKK